MKLRYLLQGWMLVILISIVLILGYTYSVRADDNESKLDPKNVGHITGSIYDAETAAPIIGATVFVEQDGVFNDKGDTVSTTNEYGAYSCATKLGHKSVKFDFGRAWSTSILEMINGSANKKTMQIDVTQAIVKVTANGYNDFEGIVGARNIDLEGFGLKIEPIFLTKKTSKERSTVGIGWGSVDIISCEVTPSIILDSKKINISFILKYPDSNSKSDICVGVNSQFLSGESIKKHSINSDGNLVFNQDFKIKKKVKGIDYVTISIEDCPYYIKSENESIIKMIQVIKDSKEEEAAKLRLSDFENRTPATSPISDISIVEDANLAVAISQAKSKCDDDKKHEDFKAWHDYMLLLLQKGALQQKSNDSTYLKTYLECRDVIDDALIASRTEKKTLSEGSFNGIFGWHGALCLGSIGFSSNEANCDFNIFQSLDQIEKSPNRYLHYLNIASALIQLNRFDLASFFIDKSLSIKPDCVEAKYEKAIVEINQNNIKTGTDILKEVCLSNPRHYKAGLVLAKIYQANNMNDEAQRYLETYAAFYKCSTDKACQSITFRDNPILPKPEIPKSVPIAPVNTSVTEIKQETSVPVPSLGADKPIKIVNGSKYILSNGSAMIPIRQICDWLGATTEYKKNTGILDIIFGQASISMAINSKNASINGHLKQITAAPIEKNGTIYIPLRVFIDVFTIKSENSKSGDIKLLHPSGNSIFRLTK